MNTTATELQSSEKEKPTKYLAHVKALEDGSFAIHELSDHLTSVARLAARFAQSFSNSDWAYLGGLWHDLGKYSEDFQHRIKTNSGFDPEAHIEGQSGRVDHSTAGAIYAVNKLGPVGRVLAYIIAGHHAGLADWSSESAGRRALAHRLKKSELLEKVYTQMPPQAILNAEHPTSKPPRLPKKCHHLWIRMLFSCVVDADFLDTERFMSPERTSFRSGFPTLQELSLKLEDYLTRLTNSTEPTLVNKIRADILQQCKNKARHEPGIFSLTVPTGGGKTLSSLAFALKHAVEYRKSRVIYVIPYTSIIEQTTNIFRQVFGDVIVEHHSNLEPDKESAKSRLASENWDAPIITTTAVQFFESLFSVRTSRVRKLHNIVNSVVILDEAQLLPPEFLKPILQVLQDLQSGFNVTLLLCTATQPALITHQYPDFKFEGLSGVTEIVDDPIELSEKLRRTQIHVPKDLITPISWEHLAHEISSYPSALCIVNRRDDSRELFKLLSEDTFHLSGYMCGEHRSNTINQIKWRIKEGIPTRVVSTQLVEAGVDIDFPIVFRALAGLDSIAQAAGRCNREGKLSMGQVFLFVPPKSSPKGHLKQGEDCARQILSEGFVDLFAPSTFEQFFQQLYWKKGGDLDRHGIIQDLTADDGLHINFRTAADKFKIIDDSVQSPVLVRYGLGADLTEQLKHVGPKRCLLRKLQRFVVNVPKITLQRLVKLGDVAEIYPGIFVQAHDALYHPLIGLMGNEPAFYDPEALII